VGADSTSIDAVPQGSSGQPFPGVPVTGLAGGEGPPITSMIGRQLPAAIQTCTESFGVRNCSVT
jgi:hypothetical protein